jgi:hypothetical protein
VSDAGEPQLTLTLLPVRSRTGTKSSESTLGGTGLSIEAVGTLVPGFAMQEQRIVLQPVARLGLIRLHDQASITRQRTLTQAPGTGVGSELPSDRGVRRHVRSATGSGRGIGDHEASGWLSFRCRLPLPSQGEKGGAPA